MAEIVHRERRDAQWAVDLIRRLKREGKIKQKELLSHIRKLPSHIQTSGLAQTLLFYRQKQRDVAKALAQRVLGRDEKNEKNEKNEDIVTAAVMALVEDANKFRMKTREALAAAQWLKRVAEVELEREVKAEKSEK